MPEFIYVIHIQGEDELSDKPWTLKKTYWPKKDGGYPRALEQEIRLWGLPYGKPIKTTVYKYFLDDAVPDRVN